MMEFLSSPMLFPSDMDSSKLTTDPNYKLPEPMNWTSHDYCNTTVTKSTPSLTDLINIEPIKENEKINVYSHSIGKDISPKMASVLDKKTTILPHDDYIQCITLLSFVQPMIHACALPPIPLTDFYKQDNNIIDQNEQHVLWTNLHGALDVVEKDLKRHQQDSLYSISENQNDNSIYYQSSIDDDLPCPDENVYVPDLVHSVCSTPSLVSLVDNHPQPTTPMFLERNIDNKLQHQKMDDTITNSITLPAIGHQQEHGKKKNIFLKTWLAKKKQCCITYLSSSSQNFCRWIKN